MTNDKSVGNPVLVLGGNGKTGRRMAERLRATGRPVRIGSRTGDPPFDWKNPSTWGLALRGVDAAYVAFQPDLAVPGALETVRSFFTQAVGSGVKKLVLLSGRGEIEAEQAEEALQATGADWTILRSSWFSQNFSEGAFLEPILAGESHCRRGPSRSPLSMSTILPISGLRRWTETGHERQLYDITGPRALTFAEAIAEIADAAGRDIRFGVVSPEDYRAELARYGLRQEDIDLVIYLMTTVLDGRNTPVADGVERALGRKPRDFSDYVRRTAASGVWNANP